MIRRPLAQAVAVSVLVLTVVSSALGVAGLVALRDRVPEGRIVIVGDRSAPAMREVLTELRARVAEGDPLTETGGELNPGVAVVIVVLLMWSAPGRGTRVSGQIPVGGRIEAG